MSLYSQKKYANEKNIKAFISKFGEEFKQGMDPIQIALIVASFVMFLASIISAKNGMMN
ncbi:MAG: hypothetical protein ACPK85_01015 [Methanosarcina sp.]